MTIKSFTLMILLIISPIAFSPLLYGQTYEFKIDSVGTMDGYEGYYQTMLRNDSLLEIDFLFEENNHLRWYAFEMSYQSTFTTLPESTYMVKLNSVNIGDTWTAWIDEPLKAEVVDTSTVTVPAGTFETIVIEMHLKSIPDSLVQIAYDADGIGGVKFIYFGDTSLLTSYSITGSSGYYPLAVGNWRRFESPSSVKEQIEQLKPSDFNLYQNYPNPFNPTTNIEYDLPTSAHVYLTIYDILGRRVAILVDELQPKGKKWVEFDASRLSSGVYFYRLQAGLFTETKKLVLLR
jgi:hypothetical protein